MDASTLSKQLSVAGHELVQLMQLFSQEEIDKVPFSGSWTAGQVGEHIFKFASGIPNVLIGKTAPPDRAPDEKVAKLRSVFLDFDAKMKSPEFIRPIESVHAKQKLIDDLSKTFQESSNAIATLDPNLLCLDFNMPVFGHLTRFELCSFELFHTQRHIHQLKKIAIILGVLSAV